MKLKGAGAGAGEVCCCVPKNEPELVVEELELPKENAPPPIVGLKFGGLWLACCKSLVGLSSILNSFSCLGGVTGRSTGAVLGWPNEKSDLLDTSAVAFPPPEKPKETGGVAAGVVDDWPNENGAGLGATIDGAGGELGLAPNEKGVLSASFLSADG